MEIVIVFIAIGVLAAGAAGLLSRQGMLPPSLFAMRGKAGDIKSPNDTAEVAISTAESQPLRPTPTAILASAANSVVSAPTDEVIEPPTVDLAGMANEPHSGNIDFVDKRLEDLRHTAVTHYEDLAQEIKRLREELVLRAEADEARRETAQERMRADMLAVVSIVVAERQAVGSARRMEISAELYAQLAKFEASLATVTNPILLPGEPYEPPTELAPESLVWENWNEVGERVFALAEMYSAQRLHLSAQTRSDVGEFVTTLRTMLTRSIYPNLQADGGAERRAALKHALGTIATELPKIRDVLETEYLEGRSG